MITINQNSATPNTGLFIERQRCACCNSGTIQTLYTTKYSDPRLSAYILKRYATHKKPITLDDIRDEEYIVLECTQCGFIWQKFVPGVSLQEKIYGTNYNDLDTLNRSLAKENQAPLKIYLKRGQRVSGIMALVGKEKPYQTRLLDFGSGWGSWARMAKGYGYDVTNIESSRKKLLHLQQGGLMATEQLNDISKEDCFDFINLDQVLEHHSEPSVLLHELADRINPGGALHISVPNGRSFNKKIATLGDEWYLEKAISPLEHINCFTAHSLNTLASQVGLQPMPTIRLLSAFGMFQTALYLAKKRRKTDLYYTKPRN